jgi:hypothetical protein
MPLFTEVRGKGILGSPHTALCIDPPLRGVRMASEALHAAWRRSTYLWWMDMHRDGCSGECDHTRSFLCTPLPLRTPNNVHKKDPGRGRMGEPKPTRASMVMVAPITRSRATHNRAASEGRAKRDGVINETARPRTIIKAGARKPHPDKPRTAVEGILISPRVLCARTAGESGSVLRSSGGAVGFSGKTRRRPPRHSRQEPPGSS